MLNNALIELANYCSPPGCFSTSHRRMFLSSEETHLISSTIDDGRSLLWLGAEIFHDEKYEDGKTATVFNGTKNVTFFGGWILFGEFLFC